MKIAILGDSISEGIGNKKINYLEPLNNLLRFTGEEISIKNFAKTGTTIDYALNIIEEVISFNPEVVIIMYGSVDAQIRPNIEKNRFYLRTITPSKYKNIGGMLEPRALYSKKLVKRIPQKLDNCYRKVWKKIMVLTQGTFQKVELDNFKQKYKCLLDKLSKYNCKVICLSTIYIDDEYFLESSKEYHKYNLCIEELSKEYKFKYIDIFSKFQNLVSTNGWLYAYNHDHFHPNILGLEIIAQEIFTGFNED